MGSIAPVLLSHSYPVAPSFYRQRYRLPLFKIVQKIQSLDFVQRFGKTLIDTLRLSKRIIQYLLNRTALAINAFELLNNSLTSDFAEVTVDESRIRGPK